MQKIVVAHAEKCDVISRGKNRKSSPYLGHAKGAWPSKDYSSFETALMCDSAMHFCATFD
eukprot:6183225-Pleurochrysis_carterae.AAC.1